MSYVWILSESYPIITICKLSWTFKQSILLSQSHLIPSYPVPSNPIQSHYILSDSQLWAQAIFWQVQPDIQWRAKYCWDTVNGNDAQNTRSLTGNANYFNRKTGLRRSWQKLEMMGVKNKVKQGSVTSLECWQSRTMTLAHNEDQVQTPSNTCPIVPCLFRSSSTTALLFPQLSSFL